MNVLVNPGCACRPHPLQTCYAPYHPQRLYCLLSGPLRPPSSIPREEGLHASSHLPVHRPDRGGRGRRRRRLAVHAWAPPSRPDDPEHAPGKNLPLSQVILFNSGVGYFQREGDVEGDARVDLTFPVSDVNDLLKSLVLQDLGDGKVSTVSYDSQEPVDKTLKSFALDLTNNPTLGQILNQARGEKIEVVLQQNNAGPAGHDDRRHRRHGRRSTSPARKDAMVEVDMLNLLCTEGVRERAAVAGAAAALPEPVAGHRVPPRPGSAGRGPRQPEEDRQPQLRRRRKADGEGRLRRRKPDLEDELPAGAGQEGQAVAARLGHRREHQRRGLEGRAHGAGLRPADLVPDGPVSAAVHPAADGGAGAVRVAAAADLPGRPQRPGWAANSAAVGAAAASSADRRPGRQNLRPARRSTPARTATSRIGGQLDADMPAGIINPNNDNNNSRTTPSTPS